MTLLDSPAVARDHHPRTRPVWLVKAEIMKIRTTSTWWWFLGGLFAFTAQALVRNGVSHHYDLHPPLASMSAADKTDALAVAAHAHTHAGQAAIAADMMTSGQFLGVLFAMLLGILIVTNEYAHHTATATFMATPQRGTVIAAKLAAAASFGALYWAASTALNAIVTPIYLHSQHLSITITDPTVVRSVLLNLLAFAIWAVFGLGLGTLIRGQIGAVVTGMAVYLAGAAAVEIIFNLIYQVYHHNWVLAATVVAPAVASLVMTTPGRVFDHAPPQWVGISVMVGYATVFAITGAVAIRRRDVP